MSDDSEGIVTRGVNDLYVYIFIFEMEIYTYRSFI